MLAMLAAAFAGKVRMQACTGACCSVAATADTALPHDDGACSECSSCCCEQQAAPERAEDEDDDGARGRCGPGCCVTIACEIELMPASRATFELPSFDLAVAPAPPLLPRLARRAPVRLRPFERGPPRIDGRTALRSCTVLLI